MAFTYSIEPNTFAVRIFSDSGDRPVIFQPDWPNSTPWANAQEAETWAQLCILSMENNTAPYAPAGPGLEGEQKTPS